MDSVDSYLNGGIDFDRFRVICEDVNSYFNAAVSRLMLMEDAGGTHKSILMAAALSNQIASASIIKKLDADIKAELEDPASNYSRNAGDARDAYAAFEDLVKQ
jgi:hypothetical protein